ncbi:MAG: cation:proton antiporter [Planctomycetia bacterium]|nr:cation:proton antiporter [Planctomycetia bacterium]
MGSYFVFTITVILLSGFIAGWICKRLKASPLIGYLLVGAVIGPGGLDLMGTKDIDRAIESEIVAKSSAKATMDETQTPTKTQEDPELREPMDLYSAEERIEQLQGELEQSQTQIKNLNEAHKARFDDEHEDALAEIKEERFAVEAATEFGVLLLLFAIGIEFTFDKLAATAKYMFVGGSIQMGATIGLGIVLCIIFKLGWVAGLALGSVVALSSTALVYRSMEDCGQADTRRAQATLGLLIFQDIALVPLLLILPIVLGSNAEANPSYWFDNPWIDMTLKSLIFCVVVLLFKYANVKIIAPKLAQIHSNDLVILFAIVVLLLMCLLAGALGLTPALGALAAGVALGENRLTHQIDALVLPFREAFSAMFFISLGMMTDFAYVARHPLVCLLALLGAIVFKACCATGALRACGMDFRGALAYGVSISQIGELAFMLLSVAYAAHAITDDTYHTMLFVSVASLVLTPNMVKTAMTKFGMAPEEAVASGADADINPHLLEAINHATGHAIIVGAGHIGQSLANALIARDKSVCLIDFNPVNLQPFNQNGIPTVAGDGANHDVLRSAGIGRAEIVFVTVPRDDLALNVVKAARELRPQALIACRARYRLNTAQLQRAGAGIVLCEEDRIAEELVTLLERHYSQQPLNAAHASV